MPNLAILCIVCAVAYAYRGGQIFVTEWEKRLEVLWALKGKHGLLSQAEELEIYELEKRIWPKKLRKPIYCIVTGAVFGLLAWDIWAGVIVGVGSLLPPLTTPRPLFWMWQGVYRAEEVKPNILNGWMHWLAAKWGTGKPTIYGLIYGSCRGLFELPATITLAIYYHQPLIALWGLLGGFGMPLCYYASGKLSKPHATAWSEKSYGACRGLILGGILWTI